MHSLVRLLALFDDVTLVYLSPPTLPMPEEIVQELNRLNIKQRVMTNLEEAIAISDVLYVTRIQKERFSSVEEYEIVAGSYCVDAKLMKLAKSRMIVMHPLPRVNEIAKEVDRDERAAYFRQMEYGMYMRMAILEVMIKRNEMDV